jgi:hypothetical protein
MPGLVAAVLCLVNMAFAWQYLRESHHVTGEHPVAHAALVARGGGARDRALREPASRLNPGSTRSPWAHFRV